MKLYLKPVGLHIIVFTILFVFGFSGCNAAREYLASFLEYPYGDPTSTPGQINLTATPDSNPCSYAWGSKFLPDETEEIKEVFAQADMQEVNVQMEAFGVSCIRVRSNNVAEFEALQTDFGLAIEVVDLENKKLLGNIVYDIAVVLGQIKISDLPGTQAGEVNIRFYTANDYADVWFPVEDGEDFIYRNLKGERLMELIFKE
ncbi:MAG: hypothetical protein JEZ06_16930 [Anaerolineaceae bacterium]|nr:hypothetical protein [Anaerolineaceae bacterium]